MQIADQIRDFVQRLHPEQRREVKAALRALAASGRPDVCALSDDLEGYYRLRVGKFRVVYRYLASGEIACEFIDVRATVYERFTSLREQIEARRLLEEPSVAYGRSRAGSRQRRKRSGRRR